MDSERDQIILAFGLLYGCGAVIELLIRLYHGPPQDMPPVFTRNNCCIFVGQPFVYFVLPALLWPLVMLHMILRPVVGVIRECCCCCGEEDDGLGTPSGRRDSPLGNRYNNSSKTLVDLEKGYLGSPTPSEAPTVPQRPYVARSPMGETWIS